MKASPTKAKYAALTAKDIDGVRDGALRETMIKNVLADLDGAEGLQVEKARARLAQSTGTLEQDRAKYQQMKARCGETHVGTHSIAAYLKQTANDPKSIKVERCGPPTLTDRCWQMKCEFFFRNAVGGTMKQQANFYIEGDTIVASDAL